MSIFKRKATPRVVVSYKLDIMTGKTTEVELQLMSDGSVKWLKVK